jgi:hypothetical protein
MRLLDERLVLTKDKGDYPTMEGPAFYRIRVRGKLDAQLSDRLESMTIENMMRGDGVTEAVLEGRLGDQSAFAGVLDSLYHLHLPIISVECFDASAN